MLLALVMVGCERDDSVSVPASLTEAASDPELLHGAMKRVTDVMVHDIFSPPQASRVYAYVSIAAYEVAAANEPHLASLAGHLNELTAPPAPATPIHTPSAIVHAALTVGEALTFSSADIEAYRSHADQQLRDSGVPRKLAEASRAYGDAVAQHILAWAAEDGYAQTRSGPALTVTAEPGTWQPTPPGYMDAIEPNWNQLRPFALDSAAQYAPPPPPPFSMEPGSAFYRQVMEVYEIGETLTEEQRAIASFWDCNPYVMHTRGHVMFATKKLTPGGHWMGISAIASRMQGDDIAASAEAYARTAIALADGFISVWDEKYRSNLIRPETVINEFIDEDWVPVLQTPPFPEYTSGHSVISAAAATVLTDHFGEDFAFSDTTEVEYGLPVRDFPSFDVAAEEAAESRLYGGIHYRVAAEEGLTQGRQVGAHVIERVPTRAPALASQ
ncbi:MAG: vanadium-dependent haloperoxidase [Bacteroidota bacterium]